MKAYNMTGRTGKPIANQIIIESEGARTFQSYGVTVAKIDASGTWLDETYWDYSKTTSKYLNQFLGRKAKEMLKTGEAKLASLN